MVGQAAPRLGVVLPKCERLVSSMRTSVSSAFPGPQLPAGIACEALGLAFSRRTLGSAEFGSELRIMFGALSDLKPSTQPDMELWNKAKLKSFNPPVQPPEPAEEQVPEPEERKLKSSVMSQASKLTERPSSHTYLGELHPMYAGRPDRNLHDYGQYRLNGFLQQVARSPRRLEEKVNKKRGGASAWWIRWL